jgi:hypothetical protein
MVNDPFGERLRDAMKTAGLNVAFDKTYAVMVQGMGVPPPGISLMFGKNRTDITYAFGMALKSLQILDRPIQATDLGGSDELTNQLSIFVSPP